MDLFSEAVAFSDAMCPQRSPHQKRPSYKAMPQFVSYVGEHYDISEKVSGDMFRTVIYFNIYDKYIYYI